MTQTVRSAWSNVASATTPGGQDCSAPLAVELGAFGSCDNPGGAGCGFLGATLDSSQGLTPADWHGFAAGRLWRLRELRYYDYATLPGRGDYREAVTLDSGGVDPADGSLQGLDASYATHRAAGVTPGTGHDKTAVRVFLEVSCNGEWALPDAPLQP